MEEERKYEAVKARPPHVKGAEDKVEVAVRTEAEKASLKVLYMLYKNNFLTRHVLVKMLDIMNNKKLTEDEMFQFLVDEAAKA